MVEWTGESGKLRSPLKVSHPYLIRAWYPLEVNDRTKAIVEKNIPFVLRNYLEAGYEFVILAWVMHRQQIIDRVLHGLRELDFDLHVLTLIAKEDALVDRWRARAGKDAVPATICERVRDSRGLQTKKTDTTDLEPNEVADRILESIA